MIGPRKTLVLILDVLFMDDRNATTARESGGTRSIDYIDNAIPGPAVGMHCMSVSRACLRSCEGGTTPAQKAAFGTSLDCRQILPWRQGLDLSAESPMEPLAVDPKVGQKKSS